MKVSYQWLCEYIDLTAYTPAKLAEMLTAAGLAVDAVELRHQGVEGVVVGLVTEMEDHPDADKLHVCQVDVGGSEPYQIVCGAPNVKPGLKVPVALPGAKLPGGVTIKRAKLRGVTSNGMLCSAAEIGLDTRLLPTHATSGLYLLPTDVPIGEDIVKVLHLDDFVLDVDLTPNRSDCLSIRGLVYEIAALTKQKTSFPTEIELSLPEDASPLQVKLVSDRCARYDAQMLTDLSAVSAPLWMQMRLMAMGVRPIDVIVDVTNYVMLEWGQPLHAFDAAAIADETIVVRQAADAEQLVTLDGQTRILDEDMLVIADPHKAIGLAGVMGAENSEIKQDTSRVVIESARFDALSTRRTGQKLGLRSEAQQRFEKGVDPVCVRNALLRATALLMEYAGGKAVGGPITARQTDESAAHVGRDISFSPDAARSLLGSDVADAAIVEIFGQLGFTVTAHSDEWTVTVPPRRPDLSLQADLAEEVARLYGYDKIPSTLPSGPMTAGGRTGIQKLVEQLRDALVASGLYEVRTYAFSAPEALAALQLPEETQLMQMVPLMHPMSDERRALRTHMLPSLAEVARYNLAHRVDGGAIFELGHVYEAREWPIATQPHERAQVALLWFGQSAENLYQRTRAYDFFDAKGVIETLMDHIGIEVTYTRATEPWLHPGRSAKVLSGDEVLGVVGEIHPATAAALDVPSAIYAAFDIEKLHAHMRGAQTVEQLPRFPGSRRDLALIVKEDVQVGALLAAITELTVAENNEILRETKVFDVYVGENVESGSKSVALSLYFQADERTLTDDEIDDVIKLVLARLEEKVDARLRS
ncbi:phenylalanine--tRNA ligase subunit beta [Alicyclobacillus fodiniaquatilis]|uniref:Phenylalanine--tRNA ligase beta subunit n=1 Tax=Alicyclobacillus fodiniaquatilis TaxID=1661150 RepID=A0ABW4JKI9_9BACL